jgi:hypothetical protein
MSHQYYLLIDIESELNIRTMEIDYAEISGGERIGSGASGTVRKVEFRGQQVAVKKFSAELSVEEFGQFRNEIIIASNLSHPNIVNWSAFNLILVLIG